MWNPSKDQIKRHLLEEQKRESLRSYYGKTAPISYRFRGKDDRVGNLVDFKANPTPIPMGDNGYPLFAINHPHRLTFQIRRKEFGFEFLSEYLERSVPVEKMIEEYEKICRKELGKEISEMTISKTFRLGYTGKYLEGQDLENPIIKTHSFPNGDDSVVNFLLPIKRGDEEKREEVSKILTDRMYALGYNIAQEHRIEDKFVKNPVNGIDVEVWNVYFENARPEKTVQDLPKVMYHVAPERYFEKIRKNGLVPKSKSVMSMYPERVYLLTDKNFIEDYGLGKILEMRKNNPKMKDGGFYVFLVSRESLEGWDRYEKGEAVFYKDPFFSKTGKTEDSSAIFTYDTIPPRILARKCIYIEVTNKGKIGRKKVVDFR